LSAAPINSFVVWKYENISAEGMSGRGTCRILRRRGTESELDCNAGFSAVGDTEKTCYSTDGSKEAGKVTGTSKTLTTWVIRKACKAAALTAVKKSEM
jgi:hypothetical protein